MTNQPLFYKNPIPLLKDRHANSGVTSVENFAFAKGSNTIPVNFPEFMQLAKYYPIVFSSNDSPVPLVVTGLDNNKNVFINNSGAWEDGFYVPAYIRRYPFAFTSAPVSDSDQLILCVDEDSDRFVAQAKKTHLRFFEKDLEATTTLQNILRFCEQYHRDNIATGAFCKKLNDMGLLVERKISLGLGDGAAPAELYGFKTIDEEKFNNLDVKILQEWHQQGVLGFIYFHIMSGGNWRNLVERHLKQTRKTKKVVAQTSVKKVVKAAPTKKKK